MRKIRFLTFLICALLLFPLPAAAGDTLTPPGIVDNGGRLSDNDESSLAQKINDLKAQYSVDIVIVTEKNRKESSVQAEADDLFDKGGYGLGEDKSGILLLVDSGNREWAISTHGSAISIFPSSFTRSTGDTLASSYLKYSLYYNGFTDYLSKIEAQLIHNASSNNSQTAPQDSQETVQQDASEPNVSGEYKSATEPGPAKKEEKEPPSPSDYIISALVVGLILTGIYMSRLKKQMNTANKQKNADVYRKNDQTIHIDKKDILLTSRVIRKPLPGNSTHMRNGERHGGSTGEF